MIVNSSSECLSSGRGNSHCSARADFLILDSFPSELFLGAQPGLFVPSLRIQWTTMVLFSAKSTLKMLGALRKKSHYGSSKSSSTMTSKVYCKLSTPAVYVESTLSLTWVSSLPV